MNKRIPIVAIVGRQNVGKSTLFNALIGRKKAIVDETPGLTRDVISCTVTHRDASFLLYDMPGLDVKDSSQLSALILENARRFIERASMVVLLMENPAPSSYDHELTGLVRRLSRPSIIAVNKMDNITDYENLSNFYEMGLGDVVPVSALRKVNLDLLLDKIFQLLPVKKLSVGEPHLRIAIIGRPNSGKSTLLNSLIGYNRSVVSDLPGTTRDAVDEDFTFHGKRITVIDTAGMRKRSRVKENIDYYSLTRAEESIRRCDVVVHLIDAQAGLTETDKKISDSILAAWKPVIVALNKWDAIEKNQRTFLEFKERLVFQYYRVEDFPVIAVSAREKQRIHKLITTALDLQEKAGRTVETPRLNKIIEDVQRFHRSPLLGDRLKIYYATQTGSRPPRFRLFVNRPELFRKDVMRFLEKTLARDLEISGVPIMLSAEGRKRS